MNSLAELQRRFQRRILSGDPLDAIYQDVIGPMVIYIHAYQGRMRQALSTNFPVLHRALGDEAFAALALAYCAARPSQKPSIRWLGDGLVDFLEANPQLLGHPALLDLARMDWAMRAAFDAADADCLTVEDLQQLAIGDWPALVLQTVPSFQLLELQWGVEGLWHALHGDANAQTHEPEHAPHAMVIWRQQLQCRWRAIDATELLALRLLMRGANFASLCEALQGVADLPAQHKAAQLLMTWVWEGLLARP